MNLTLLFLTAAFMQVSATGYSQFVTINLKNAPLTRVFSEIEKQTKYSFIYADRLLANTKPVTLQVSNEKLETVLALCFKDQPLTYDISEAYVVIRPKNPVPLTSIRDFDTIPRVAITGKVLLDDSTQSPLSNVTIVNRNTSQGASTDGNGIFNIMARKGDVLEISYVGMTSLKLTVKDTDKQFSAYLQRNIKEEESIIVYSTGYQSLPRERATGSFVKLNNDIVNYRVTTNIMDRLNGLANSLYVDNRTNTSKVTIRGISTIFSNTDPLIVIDNFPYEGDINNINPNDVEDITILRDAAAASIWGARAGNGVIVITTKKAGYNQPIRLSLNNNLTITEKPDLYYFPQMSVSDFIDVEIFLFDKGFYNSTLNNATSRPIVSPVVEILNKHRNGLLTQEEVNAQINALRNFDVRRDFEKYVFRHGVFQQHAIEFTGGSSTINYLLSLGYDKNLLAQVGDEYERYTIRSVNSFQPIRNLELLASIQYVLTNRQNNGLRYPLNPGGGKSVIYPYARLADEHGSPLVLERDYRQSYVDSAGGGNLLDWHYRPLQEISLGDNTSQVQDILLNFNAKYKFNSFLAGQVLYQLEKSSGGTRNYFSEQTYFTRNLINRYSQLNGNSVTRIIPLGGILDMSQSNLTSHSLRAQLNFDRQWRNIHSLNVIAGAEVREIHSTSNSHRIFGYNEDKLVYGNVDLVNRYPIYGNLSSNSIVPNSIGLDNNIDRFVSFFANLAYTYKQRYILSLSARKDAANIFGVDINDKWKPLWSVGGSWNMSNESFYNVSWLPYLKLRSTYGYSGNVNNTTSGYLTIAYAPIPDSYTNLPYSNINNPPNPKLRWEEVRMLNIGVDFATANNRVSGSFELYKKSSKDLIAPTALDPTTGIITLYANSAHIEGTGIDLQLNTKNINGKFKWESNLLLSYSKNKISKYFSSITTASFYVGSGISVNPLEGKLTNALFSYAFAGLDEGGNPQGYLNKEITKDYAAIQNSAVADLVYHGSTIPLLQGAIRNSFYWKAWTLSINLRYAFNYYFRRNTINYSDLFGTWGGGHKDYEKRWMQPGDENLTTVPSMVYPTNSNRDNFYANSEVTVEKGDHIRIQDIRLGYDLKFRIARAQLSTFQFYLSASNVGIIWRASDIKLDPDFASGYLPTPSMLAFGVKANF